MIIGQKDDYRCVARGAGGIYQEGLADKLVNTPPLSLSLSPLPPNHTCYCRDTFLSKKRSNFSVDSRRRHFRRSPPTRDGGWILYHNFDAPSRAKQRFIIFCCGMRPSGNFLLVKSRIHSLFNEARHGFVGVGVLAFKVQRARGCDGGRSGEGRKEEVFELFSST